MNPIDDNSHDGNGRFAKGNRGGPGNPLARRTARLRAALVKAITPDDIRAAVQQLIHKARTGDIVAIRELLDRGLGKATQAVAVEAIVQASIPVKQKSIDYDAMRRRLDMFDHERFQREFENYARTGRFGQARDEHRAPPDEAGNNSMGRNPKLETGET